MVVVVVVVVVGVVAELGNHDGEADFGEPEAFRKSGVSDTPDSEEPKKQILGSRKPSGNQGCQTPLIRRSRKSGFWGAGSLPQIRGVRHP